MSDFPKGICRLSVVPMRMEANHDGVLVSQLLFGEHYMVTDQIEDWLLIELDFDRSTGWICVNQHCEISDDYFRQINLSDYKVCTDISGTIFFQKMHVNILVGSILPISTNELFKLEEQIAYNGESKSLSQKREFEFLKERIKSYRHTPYLPGGKTPFGIDASGFLQQVMKLCGYRFPRGMASQIGIGSLVQDISLIEPGDVVFLGEGLSTTVVIFLGGEEYIGMINGQIQITKDLMSISDKKVIKRILIENKS
ncbi:MAG: C40 family peptidase [Reichenbachiella sp.]